jgi:glycosyltransferase involved in cell wall biosynthesis
LGPLAQSVEQRTFNPWVVGSIPTGPTIYLNWRNAVRNIGIIIDDFKIGGIQRIALDQAYALNESGILGTIVVLGSKPSEQVPSFLHTEKQLIEELNLKILFFEGSKYVQFEKLQKYLKTNKPELLICYSLRGTVLTFLCKKIIHVKPKVVTVIEQLLSMSAPIQRIRRIFYSQFTDILFAYSEAVKKDWDFRRKRNAFIWLISSRKAISVCRNGVYLPRIRFNRDVFFERNNDLKRLLFVNRLTAWKGLPIALKIIEKKEFSASTLLLVTPEDPEKYLIDTSPEVRKRVSSIVGKSVSQIEFYPGDVHIYPASYGETSRFIEAVSINVLEMACFGVKSFVTKNGVETWPELVEHGMIHEVDWGNLPSTLNTILAECASADVSEIDFARDLIDINNNIYQIFDSAGLDRFPRIKT